MFDIFPYIPYFEIKTSVVSSASGQPIQLVRADPTRVVLIVSAPVNVGVRIVPPTNPTMDPPVWRIVASGTEWFSWQRQGIFPTLEWWSGGPAPYTPYSVGVTEITWTPSQGDE